MLLTVDAISKSYPAPGGGAARPVLREVSFELDTGQSLALTGDSGSGKSTLLHIVGALDQADAGRVMLAGREITGLNDAGRAEVRRRDIGFVFQQFNLIPSLTVAGNIAFQARLAGRFDAGWADHVTQALGLEAHTRAYPETLSGGQQQRVAVARALAGRPGLILADEPTGNLDQDAADRVLDLMQDLVAQSGAALMMVTHSARLARRMDRRLSLRAGRVA